MIKHSIYDFKQTNGYYGIVLSIIKNTKQALTCSKSAVKIYQLQ